MVGGDGLALGWRFKLLVEVSKVCQVSQLYASIDGLATRKLGSMLPSLFTLQASLVFLMDMCYSPFFLCTGQMETDKYTESVYLMKPDHHPI